LEHLINNKKSRGFVISNLCEIKLRELSDLSLNPSFLHSLLAIGAFEIYSNKDKTIQTIFIGISFKFIKKVFLFHQAVCFLLHF